MLFAVLSLLFDFTNCTLSFLVLLLTLFSRWDRPTLITVDFGESFRECKTTREARRVYFLKITLKVLITKITEKVAEN